jgi:hypothetical protein
MSNRRRPEAWERAKESALRAVEADPNCRKHTRHSVLSNFTTIAIGSMLNANCAKRFN